MGRLQAAETVGTPKQVSNAVATGKANEGQIEQALKAVNFQARFLEQSSRTTDSIPLPENVKQLQKQINAEEQKKLSVLKNAISSGNRLTDEQKAYLTGLISSSQRFGGPENPELRKVTLPQAEKPRPNTELAAAPLGSNLPSADEIGSLPLNSLSKSLSQEYDTIISFLDQNREMVKNLSFSGRGKKDLADIENIGKIDTLAESKGIYIWTIQNQPDKSLDLLKELLAAVEKAVSYVTLENRERLSADPNPGGIIVLRPALIRGTTNHGNQEVDEAGKVITPGYSNDPAHVGETVERLDPDTYHSVVDGVVRYDKIKGYYDLQKRLYQEKWEIQKAENPSEEDVERHYDCSRRAKLCENTLYLSVLEEALKKLTPK